MDVLRRSHQERRIVVKGGLEMARRPVVCSQEPGGDVRVAYVRGEEYPVSTALDPRLFPLL